MATQLENDPGYACSANDPLLRDVLGSATEELREEAMSELLSNHVYGRVDRILGARFRRSGISSDLQEDVRAEILLKLVARLRRLIDDPDSQPVSQFADYVAVVAFNTFHDFVRGAFPQRAKLKNRILYALRHDSRFAVWQAGDALFCGLAEWTGRSSAFRGEAGAVTVLAGTDLRAVLADFLAQAGTPLEVDAVVARVAEAQFSAAGPGEPSAARPTGSDELERFQSLNHLWSEIAALPPNQRVALLLSARDSTGESVLRLLPFTGIATIRELAATLNLEAPLLAELWRALPLDDHRIAAMLQVTRPQVINLRRAARERLTRRLHGGTPGRRMR